MDKKEAFSLKLKKVVEAARLKTGLSIEDLARLCNMPSSDIALILDNPGKVPGGQLMIVLERLDLHRQIIEILQNPDNLKKFLDEA